MTKKGEIPHFVTYLILALILLVIISVSFIGKLIPDLIKDFLGIPKEAENTWGSLFNKTEQQELAGKDAAFVKTYYAKFFQALDHCLASSKTNCWCRVASSEQFPENYRIFVDYYQNIGYFSYPGFVRADGHVAPLADVTLLFGSTAISTKLCLARNTFKPIVSYDLSSFSLQQGDKNYPALAITYSHPEQQKLISEVWSYQPQRQQSDRTQLGSPPRKEPSVYHPQIDVYKMDASHLCFIPPGTSSHIRSLDSCTSQTDLETKNKA